MLWFLSYNLWPRRLELQHIQVRCISLTLKISANCQSIHEASRVAASPDITACYTSVYSLHITTQPKDTPKIHIHTHTRNTHTKYTHQNYKNKHWKLASPYITQRSSPPTHTDIQKHTLHTLTPHTHVHIYTDSTNHTHTHTITPRTHTHLKPYAYTPHTLKPHTHTHTHTKHTHQLRTYNRAITQTHQIPCKYAYKTDTKCALKTQRQYGVSEFDFFVGSTISSWLLFLFMVNNGP